MQSLPSILDSLMTWLTQREHKGAQQKSQRRSIRPIATTPPTSDQSSLTIFNALLFPSPFTLSKSFVNHVPTP